MEERQRKTTSKKKTQVREKEHSKSKRSVIIPEQEDGGVEKGTERYLKRRKRRTHREGKEKKKPLLQSKTVIEEMEHWIQRREGKKISRKESQRITRRKTKKVNGELSFQKNPRNGGGRELTDKEIRNLIQENAPGLRDRSVETEELAERMAQRGSHAQASQGSVRT